MEFTDKVVLVTGSSSGIGAATATMFAKAGAKVVINYKSNESGAQNVYQKIATAGGDSVIIHADVSKEAEAQKLISATIDKYGKLDILVNNAGSYFNEDEWNGSSLAWQETISANLYSTLNCSKYACEHFINKQTGIIINIASRYAFSSQYDAIAYSAAKAGIVNITQAYAKLLAPFGRANSVSPGLTKAGYWMTAPTEELMENIKQIRLKTAAEADDISESVIFLASDRARMITGQNITVDGGAGLV